MLAAGTRACAPLVLARGPLALARETPIRGCQSRGRAHQGPRAQWRPLRVRRAALARIPASAAGSLLARAQQPAGQARTTRVLSARGQRPRQALRYRRVPKRTRTAPAAGMPPVAPAGPIAAGPTRAGPVRVRRPGGTEGGASSAPRAWPSSRAPEATRVFPGGPPRPARPPLAKQERRSQRHDRATGLGRPPARSEACVQDRWRVPSGAEHRTLGWSLALCLPPVLGWSLAPVRDRRSIRVRGWLLGTGQSRGTGRPRGTGSVPGSGGAAATG